MAVCKLVSVLQVRRQGEADAELRCPVITVVAAVAARPRLSQGWHGGHREGLARARCKKTANVKREGINPNSLWGEGALDTTSKPPQMRTRT